MPNDEAWMRQALRLAQNSVGLASPNPQVGCILVKDEKNIGEGAHLYDAFDHAEIVALKQAAARGLNVAGATAYVTLEPCSHHGRTGPCADALIAAGITRVVVATADPNPSVSGTGLDRLRSAGIAVTLGVLETETRHMLDAFAHFIQRGTPFVTLKAALSADGKLAPPPSARTPNQPFWLTGPAARAEVQQLRHAADALLTGIGTVLADDPSLTDRTGLPRRRPLLRVLLDTHLRLPLSSQLVRQNQNDLLVVCTANAPASRIAALEALGVEVLLAPENDGRISLPSVLATLADRSLISVLLEAGSTLNAAFLRQQLVDRVALFYAPRELGPDALPFAEASDPSFALEQRLTRPHKQTIGPDLLVTGLLHDPWPAETRLP